MSPELDLEALLGNDIAEALATLDGRIGDFWRVKGPIAEDGKTKYEIDADGTKFIFYTSEGRKAVLEWETFIPSELSAGGTADDLITFLDQTTVFLPKLLFAKDQKEKMIRNSYGIQSTVFLDHTDGDRTKYRLNNRNGLIRLAEAFCSPDAPYDISGFIVEAQPDVSKSSGGRFGFGVEYFSGSSLGRGRFSLGVSLEADSARAFNPDFTNWAMSTHQGFLDQSPWVERYVSEKGIAAVATDLSKIIQSKFPQP